MLVVINLAGKSMIHAIIQIIASFAVANGFADNFGDQGAGCGHHKSAGFGNNLNVVFAEQAFNFRIQFFSQSGKRFYFGCVFDRKPAANIQNFFLFAFFIRKTNFKIPQSGFLKNRDAQI